MEAIQDITHSLISFSSDAVLVLVFIILGTAVSLYFGKAKILSMVFSFYPAVVLFENIKFLESFVEKNPQSLKEATPSIAIFIAIFLICFFAIRRYIFAEFPFSRIGRLLESIIYGAIFASLCVYFLYHVINIQKIYNFSPGIDALFISTVAYWWLLIPFGVTLLLIKK
jgi:hypothetical protein